MILDPLTELIEEAESWKCVTRPNNHAQAMDWVQGVFDRLNTKEAFTHENDLNAAYLRLTYTLAKTDPVQYLRLASQNPEWFEALKIVCAEMLRRHDELPHELANWIADTLVGKVKRPKQKGGRPRSSTYQAAIWMTVSQLVRWGWTKSRNDVSPSTSACDVVAEALTLSFDRVKEIAEDGWVRQRYFLHDWDFSRGGKIAIVSPP